VVNAGHPSEIFLCPSFGIIDEKPISGIPKTLELTSKLYEEVVQEVNKAYELSNDKSGFAGCLVRVAGHDFMDYRKNGGGGSDGCINFNDEDNKGLSTCI
jgi:hypothetical protein